jgi:hypothetical protein
LAEGLRKSAFSEHPKVSDELLQPTPVARRADHHVRLDPFLIGQDRKNACTGGPA